MIDIKFIETVFVRVQDLLYEWRDGEGHFFDEYYETDLMLPSYRPWECNDHCQLMNDIALLKMFSEVMKLSDLDFHYFQFLIYYLTSLIYYQILETE